MTMDTPFFVVSHGAFPWLKSFVEVLITRSAKSVRCQKPCVRTRGALECHYWWSRAKYARAFHKRVLNFSRALAEFIASKIGNASREAVSTTRAAPSKGLPVLRKAEP